MAAESPKQAKSIANKIPTEDQKEWHKTSEQSMKDILLAKANSCDIFKQTLIATNSNKIVEATNNLYWGCGLTPDLAATTDSNFYKGKNTLGKILVSES